MQATRSASNSILLMLAILAATPWTGAVAEDNAADAGVKEQAHRASCANNLKQLGTALSLYESVPAYNTFPPTLEVLYRDYIADNRAFQCPSVKEGQHIPSPPELTDSKGRPNQLKFCDYIYIPGQSSDNAENIVAFCRCGNHHGEGANVLLAAGSVEWCDKAGLKKAILATCERMKLSLDRPVEAKASLTKEESANLEKAIEDLGSDAFEVRDKARKTLAAAGETARKLLETGAKADDPERASASNNLLTILNARQENFKKQSSWILSMREALELDGEGKK